MERIYAFLPSVLILAFIASTTFIYIKWIAKRFGDNLKSIEWQQKNSWKLCLTFTTPVINIYVPAIEELFFRAPIITAFDTISPIAWYGIFISGGIFALLHWYGDKIGMLDILTAKENGKLESDNIETETNRLSAKKGKKTIARKAVHVILSFPLGILTGYCGIKYQSIWIAFGIHSIWNLIMPIVLPTLIIFIMLLGQFFWSGISFFWNLVRKVRERQGMSW